VTEHIDGITEHVARKLAAFAKFNPDVIWTAFVGEAKCALAAVEEFELRISYKRRADGHARAGEVMG
jgi:hypothetical protein